MGRVRVCRTGQARIVRIWRRGRRSGEFEKFRGSTETQNIHLQYTCREKDIHFLDIYVMLEIAVICKGRLARGDGATSRPRTGDIRLS